MMIMVMMVMMVIIIIIIIIVIMINYSSSLYYGFSYARLFSAKKRKRLLNSARGFEQPIRFLPRAQFPSDSR
jgi:preprotein translocase subunit SecG